MKAAFVTSTPQTVCLLESNDRFGIRHRTEDYEKKTANGESGHEDGEIWRYSEIYLLKQGDAESIEMLKKFSSSRGAGDSRTFHDSVDEHYSKLVLDFIENKTEFSDDPISDDDDEDDDEDGDQACSSVMERDREGGSGLDDSPAPKVPDLKDAGCAGSSGRALSTTTMAVQYKHNNEMASAEVSLVAMCTVGFYA